MARLGALLDHALSRIESSFDEANLMAVAAHVGFDMADMRLPVVLKSNRLEPVEGESWDEYKCRAEAELANIRDLVGEEAEFLYAGASVATSLPPEQAKAQVDNPLLESVELDPMINPSLMDDAIVDVGLAPFKVRYGNLTGTGVKVAVLDSGVDKQHPHLVVADSVSTCGESVDLPGQHGTHCAGSIASRDAAFPGVAPDVTLLNVKVMRADGSATHTFIQRGIDEAMNRGADILSMSLGFNHLPRWSWRGHGWQCPDGRCPLCTAVDRAVGFGRTVIAAAGNERQKADALRGMGQGATFKTEYGCPGQSRGAITIGAVTKSSFLPAPFSSRGATSYGGLKPQLAAPGVNIMSTVPVPRDPNGIVMAGAPRALLFKRLSGTSMATPIVAGIAALIMQERRLRGLPVSPADMLAELQRAVSALPHAPDVVGAGLSDLDRY